jgi:thiol-disulfide isomerase/thioredoxin
MSLPRRLGLLMLLAGAAWGANGDRIVVPLRLNRDAPQPLFGLSIDFAASAGGTRVGKAPGGVTVRAEPVPGGYRLRISTGRPGDKDRATEVTAAQPALFEIERPGGLLPYRIRLDTSVTPATLDWFPRYRMEGTLEAGSCRAVFALIDANGDGVFEKEDLRAVTSAAVDLDGDGKAIGPGELMFGGQVFPFCGKSFFVDPNSVARDGSRVVVVETSIRVPALGAPLPPVVMKTMDGKTLLPENWRGKAIVLDFWASWCVHCLVNFPALERIQQETPGLEVIGVNIDEPESAGAARKILTERHLPWAQVLLSGGLVDPIWQMFRSIGGGHGAPYYVLIDPDSIVRYAGSGGQDLRDLSKVVEQWKPRGPLRQ